MNYLLTSVPSLIITTFHFIYNLQSIKMEFGYIVIEIIRWSSITFGSYLFWYLIQYIQSKPPAYQTLLDGVYVHLFQYFIFIGICNGICVSTIEVVGSVPNPIAFLFSATAFLVLFMYYFQLLFSVIIRCFLIFNQGTLDIFNDGDVLRRSRYKFMYFRKMLFLVKFLIGISDKA